LAIETAHENCAGGRTKAVGLAAMAWLLRWLRRQACEEGHKSKRDEALLFGLNQRVAGRGGE
jgi:hypothetical protein